MAAGTPAGYIEHHLRNLTFGRHPDGSWGFAHSGKEATDMGFMAIHVDTMFWSISLGILFLWFFAGLPPPSPLKIPVTCNPAWKLSLNWWTPPSRRLSMVRTHSSRLSH